MEAGQDRVVSHLLLALSLPPTDISAFASLLLERIAISSPFLLPGILGLAHSGQSKSVEAILPCWSVMMSSLLMELFPLYPSAQGEVSSLPSCEAYQASFYCTLSKGCISL